MSTTKDLHILFRRSLPSDAKDIARLTRLGTVTPCVPCMALFSWRTTADFVSLIERSVICITAISTITKMVVGFICLDDIPHISSIPADTWEKTLKHNTKDNVDNNNNNISTMKIAPYNTLWVKCVLAPPSSAFEVGFTHPNDTNGKMIQRELLLHAYREEDLLNELFSVSLINLPGIMHLLIPFPEGVTYKQLESFGIESIPVIDCEFKGSLLHIPTTKVVHQLQLRLGIVEDYDDFVPDLLSGHGLITALPEEFYLEEILSKQDKFRKVIAAEDSITHRVVGLMCLEAFIEDQQHVTRQYMTELFGKFRFLKNKGIIGKNISVDKPNIVKIYFFHIDPKYAIYAGQFLPFIFKEFPFVEYAMIILPYTQEEPPFLCHFENVPLRRYQPRNSKGEIFPTPNGLWVACRYAADPVTVVPVHTEKDVEAISMLLKEPLTGFSPQHIAALLEDINVVRDGSLSQGNETSESISFSLVTDFGEEGIPTIVGVASARRITLDEMYALRANYDLDDFVNYYTSSPRDYSATAIHLSAEEGRRKFFRREMQGILVRSFYVKSVYRHHISFFIRELLRHTHCEVALVLEDGQSSPFAPLLRHMLRVTPRRVQEKRRMNIEEGEENGENKATVGGRDVAALGCLFVSTRRILGDRKKFVHTRIIVIGAGSTGLACIYRLLSVPYVCFTNIVLISTDDMPLHPNRQPYLWGADRMEMLEREHMALLVGDPVRVVHGTVMDFDTTQQYVTIDDGTYEPYDYVLLTTGRQYIVSNSICTLHSGYQQHQARGFVPKGTLALSGKSFFEKLRQHLYDMDCNPENISNIIVYGSGLDAFAVATSIVGLGFSSQRIVMVSPEMSNPFVDIDAYECVVKLWNSFGTNVLRGYRITRMEYDDEGNTLTTVVLSPIASSEKDGKSASTGGSTQVELSCGLIVVCEEKDIDYNILSTLNRRSIVFDGRVIVKANYRTTGDRVYAAGPVAMFTRRYGTTPSFDEFNARDVGTSLAEVLLSDLGFKEFANKDIDIIEEKDMELVAAHNELYTKVLQENGSRVVNPNEDLKMTSGDGDSQCISKLQQKLPLYSSPLTSRIRLPENYIFFLCRSVEFVPERCLRLTYSCIKENKPLVMRSLGLDLFNSTNGNHSTVKISEQSLFVIYVDEQTHYIEAVVYFGNADPEFYHYMSLVGMPQSLLNLIYRYNEGRIANGHVNNNTVTCGNSGNCEFNLMEYLRSPKFQIIFYDRFIVFYRQLREKMRTHEELLKIKASVLDDVNQEYRISETKRKEYLDELTAQKNTFTRQVQYELLKFLHESKDYLPQIFYLTDISQHVQHNMETTT